MNESISILHQLSHSRLMAMDPWWCSLRFHLGAKSDRTPFTFLSVLTLSLRIAWVARDDIEYEGETSTPDWNKLASISHINGCCREQRKHVLITGEAAVIFPTWELESSRHILYTVKPKHNTRPTSERSSDVSACSCWRRAGNQNGMQK